LQASEFKIGTTLTLCSNKTSNYVQHLSQCFVNIVTIQSTGKITRHR